MIAMQDLKHIIHACTWSDPFVVLVYWKVALFNSVFDYIFNNTIHIKDTNMFSCFYLILIAKQKSALYSDKLYTIICI